MSTTNNGGQVLTFDYKQEGTSQGFNRLFYKVLPVGIISGGELNRTTDASITISPMVAMFEDTQNKVAVRIETTTNAIVGVSTSAPYVIAKFKWINVEENYVEFTASEFGSIEEDAIVLGKCVYKSNVLSGFDYTRKTWSQDHYWNKDYLDFNVTPNEPEDKTIKIGKGKAIIGGKVVDFAGGTKTINTEITMQRIDLISIDKEGKVVITEGVQSEAPKIPIFPSDMLTVASIKMGSNPQTIKGNMITNYYNSNFIQSSSALKLATIISKDESIEYVQEDMKYIIENTTKSLTLDKATQKGCTVQVYANIKDAKLILKHPNVIYKLTKGEYINLIWNGIDWVDIDRITSWDLRNTPYSVPLSADLNNYITAGTWKIEKMLGIKHIPTLVTQAEESGNDGKSYCTLIVEEGTSWVKQYIYFTNTSIELGNGSGHYQVTRGGLVSPEGEVQWQEEWSCKADEANKDASGNVITTTYATKKELSLVDENLTNEKAITLSHRNDKDNPHSVTAEQVGLGNVPNLSAQSFFNILHPVHSTYIQYTKGDAYTPEKLFNGNGITSSWQLVNDDAHEYLYTAGNKDNIGETRNESVPNITGITVLGSNASQFTSNEGNKGAFYAQWSAGAEGVGGVPSVNYRLHFNASRTSSGNGKAYQDGANVRPRSHAIGIWERIS